MNFNADRIARLSGIISRDEYRDNALNESARRHRLVEAEEDDNNPKFEEADEKEDEGGEPEEKKEGDTVEEAKLRRIIRKEVGQVIDEVMAAREAKQLQHAQKTRSVSRAMGFSSSAFSPKSNRKNRAGARGNGGRHGFGGPGFM